MALISILIGLGIEYYYGALDHLRNYSWFDRYVHWLEYKCNDHKFWNGPLGVLLTLGIPLLALLLIGHILGMMSFLLIYLFAIAVFIYSLGTSVNDLLDHYIHALKEADSDTGHEIEQTLGIDADADTEVILKQFLISTHNNIFAVIFWFIVLGIFGAFLYSLVVKLKEKFSEVHGGYGTAVNSLHLILMWIPARLMVIGFALGGSLVHALEGWTSAEGNTLENSETVIGQSGLAAIQFQQDDSTDRKLDNLLEIKDLLNRTLIIWLTVLGLMTLSGWLT